jgi:hypothetical protein
MFQDIGSATLEQFSQLILIQPNRVLLEPHLDLGLVVRGLVNLNFVFHLLFSFRKKRLSYRFFPDSLQKHTGWFITGILWHKLPFVCKLSFKAGHNHYAETAKDILEQASLPGHKKSG